MPGADEPLGDGMIKESQQRAVEIGNVQLPTRLGLQPELKPRQHFSELLRRTYARAKNSTPR